MIRQLDAVSQLQLRSGVVVDSVTSAVRELLQNSVDARASAVLIKLDLPTLSVCVEDNGVGILPELLPLVGLRYHTSKTVSVKHFGFRGEALRSIADCCSSLVVCSRSKTHVVKGKSASVASVLLDAFEPSLATCVIASRLFGPSPVRWESASRDPKKIVLDLKFVLFECLLFHPGINVKVLLREADQFSTVLSVPSRNASSDLFTHLFGETLFDEVSGSFEDVSLHGYISKTPTQKSLHRFLFLNNRKIVSPAILRHVLDMFARSLYFSAKGYFGRAMKWYPSFIFLIKAPFEPDDVLQSPHKDVLVPSCEHVIRGLLRQTVSDYLGLFQPSPVKRSQTARISEPSSPGLALDDDIPLSQLDTSVFQDPIVLGQIFNSFVVLVQPQGLFLVDQHAADERVTFEQLLSDFIRSVRDGQNIRVKLAEPIELTLNENQLEEVLSHQEVFQSYGIDFCKTGSTLAVTHLPAILVARAPQPLAVKACILQHVSDLQQRTKAAEINENWFMAARNIPRGVMEAMVSKSCQQAIKFGDFLADSEQQFLVGQLAQCRVPFQCSHGRPTVFPVADLLLPEFSEDELV